LNEFVTVVDLSLLKRVSCLTSKLEGIVRPKEICPKYLIIFSKSTDTPTCSQIFPVTLEHKAPRREIYLGLALHNLLRIRRDARVRKFTLSASVRCGINWTRRFFRRRKMLRKDSSKQLLRYLRNMLNCYQCIDQTQFSKIF